jgi:ribonucleoside-diphosphate reductase alpha chain
VKKEMRGAVGEGASGGQNSGDAGGSHSGSELKAASSEPTAQKKTYTAEEKRVCSIEAMKNGEECEACQ